MSGADAGAPVDLARWADGIPVDAQVATLVAAGLDDDALSDLANADPTAGISTWERARLITVPAAAAMAKAGRFGLLTPSGTPDPSVRDRLRLAVAASPDADDVAARLLRCDAVAAVAVVGPTTARSLGPAQWVGVTPGALAEELAPMLSALDTAVTVEALPDRPDGVHVEVLVAGPTLAEALADLRTRDGGAVLADLVVLPRTSGRPWAEEQVEMAAIRDLTDAIVVALVGDDLGPADLAAALVEVHAARRRGTPLDLALTGAFGRRLLIVADIEALIWSGVIPMAGPPPAAAHEATAEIAEAAPSPSEEAAAGAEPAHAPVPSVARTTRSGTARSAPPGRPRLRERVRDVVAQAAPPPRFLQCTVGDATTADGSPAARDNVLRIGSNRVDVFVGPQEEGTILGRAMSNAALGFGRHTRSVTLTAVLVPLEPTGPAQSQDFEIPRTGRSETAALEWSLPPGTRHARARLDLIHRNRVLQTGVLSGDVGGGPVTLTEIVVLFHDFASLDDRSEFDLALVLNHDDTGRAGVVAHRGRSTQQILAVAELEAIAGRLRQQLLAAAFLPATGATREDKVRKLFIETAVEGANLRNQLGPAVDRLQDVRRMQIVTARASWFLPLELVYERSAPDDDAVLCPRWRAGEPCGDECFADGDEYGVVCPSAFWGMSRVIERHWVDAVDASAATFLVGASPRRRRATLPIKGALLAASQKVGPADVRAAGEALGGSVVVADGWEAWQDAIADPAVKADLLVVLPHTDPVADTMEISGTTLRGGRFEGPRHVTGTRRGQPVVVLFGCDTAGTESDPAGWATRFMRARAGVVFATLTMVLNRHAAALSQRLATELRRPDRTAVPVGELVREFRVAAVRDGLLAALAITAYGDADWKV